MLVRVFLWGLNVGGGGWFFGDQLCDAVRYWPSQARGVPAKFSVFCEGGEHVVGVCCALFWRVCEPVLGN